MLTLAQALHRARQTGRTQIVQCPLHEDDTPSCTVTQGRKEVLVHCFAGCSPVELLKCMGDIKPFTPAAPTPHKPNMQAQRLWDDAQGANTLVRCYLDSRGLAELEHMPSVLRFHNETGVRLDGDTVSYVPAMLARVDSAAGALVTVHRTFLNGDGTGMGVKRLMPCIRPGASKGAAVRLQPCEGNTLGIAEGIETALACHLLHGIPVWSAISAGGLKSFVPPAHVTNLVIFADNDVNQVGQTAADELATRMKRRGIKTFIETPDEPGDWLDVYNGG